LNFWDTARRLALLSSNFPSKPRASELPQQLASNLLRLGHRHSVSLQWTWQTPASDRLEEVFRTIRFGRCLMMLNLQTNSPPVNFDGSVISDQGALPAGFINGTERWYGTPYLATGISVEQLISIENSAAHMDNVWKLPGNNRFLPDDVMLVSGSDSKPSLVHSAEKSGAFPSRSQVWHALDNSFGSPKQVRIVLFFCNASPKMSLKFTLLAFRSI
jgi:secreted Zn-dependent insulinase-like peptidase